MGKYFPKLTQTEVFIQTDEHGGGFNCPMLPVSALAEMENISLELSKAETIEAAEAVRSRMRSLACTVLPKECHDMLVRFGIPQLSDLIAYLMYGDPGNDDQPKKEAKPKN